MLLPGISAVSYSRRACLPLFIEGFSKHATRTRKQCTSRLGNLTRSSSSKPRSDPFAKRPNKVCDPYGQGGKPLSRVEAEGFQATLHDDWKIEGDDVPTKIVREFAHPDFLAGARFIQKAAAVATIHNHFPPVICLERRIFQKNWQVVTRIECRTTVLDGLSKHDFHLAMVRVCSPL